MPERREVEVLLHLLMSEPEQVEPALLEVLPLLDQMTVDELITLTVWSATLGGLAIHAMKKKVNE